MLSQNPASPVKDIRAALTARLDDVKEQSDRLITLYQEADIPLESVTGRLRELEAERDRLEAQLAGTPHIFIDHRREWAELLARREMLDSPDVAEQRGYVASIVRRVVVMPDRSVKVEWRI